MEDMYKLLNKTAKDISNCVSGDYETKETIKESVLQLVAMSCLYYSKNNDFKIKIDELNKYFEIKLSIF